MLGISLGRRFERLLFFTAPLSFVSFVVFFLAVASFSQNERIDARCYLSVAGAISEHQTEAEKLWHQVVRAKPRDKSIELIEYHYGLKKILIPYDLLGCDSVVDKKLEELHEKNTPMQIVEHLRLTAAQLLNKPVSLYGIELPERATFAVLGTDIKVSTLTLDQILKIVLAPVLLSWLGSLYNTRYREGLLISQASGITEIFPHAINVYPVGNLTAPRKKSWAMYYFPHFCRLWCALVRMALLSVFIAPPVLAYVFSLILAPLEVSGALTVVLGSVVTIFAFVTLMGEINPWHYRRIFPAPELHWN